jgi:hypothetical protein
MVTNNDVGSKAIVSIDVVVLSTPIIVINGAV